MQLLYHLTYIEDIGKSPRFFPITQCSVNLILFEIFVYLFIFFDNNSAK